MKEEKLKHLASKMSELMPDIRRLMNAPKHFENAPHLAPHQFFCLAIVNKGGTVAMKELGLKMSVSKQQLTRIIDSLERLELIERLNLPENRRLLYVRLTKNGEELVKRYQWAAMQRCMQSFCVLDEPDIDRLIFILNEAIDIIGRLNLAQIDG